MITAIGNPVYDYIKTQKIETDGRVLSGCSTNAALVLSRLGQNVRLIGAIGKDYKVPYLQKLSSRFIEPILINSVETGGFSLVYYDNIGNRTLDLLGRAHRAAYRVVARETGESWTASRHMRCSSEKSKFMIFPHRF